MKAILLALLFGLLLFSCASLCLNRKITRQPVRLLMAVFFGFLPLLVAAHLLTSPDLGILPAGMVAPVWWVDLGFALFLYAAGFFGGVLQLYNLADRGFSLRILIDILEAPDQIMTLDDVMTRYSANRGIHWMYDKRIAGMREVGLIDVAGDRVVLTEKGRRAATLFARLQDFARMDAASGAGR